MGWPMTPGKSEEQIDVRGSVEVTEDEKTNVAVQAQAVQDVKAIEKNHQFDPNLPDDEIEKLREAAKTNNLESVISVEKDFTEDSPYEAV